MASKWLSRVGLVLVLASSLASACGEDGDSGPKSYVGQDKTVMIQSTVGGLVATGAVNLRIPGGALAADTAVTLAVRGKQSHPNADTIAVDVYDFGPDGTTFLKPVPIEFDLSGVKLSNAKAEIAWLDSSGKWNKLADSLVSNGKVTATTTHFTPFTVILTFEGKGVQSGGECGAAFSACGGDIKGTWSYTGACLTLPPGVLGSGDKDPYASCTAKPTAAVTFDLTGTAAFAADGKYSVNQTSTTSFEISIPNSCIEQIGMGKISCEDFDGKPVGNACVSGQEADMETHTSTGTYTTSGSKLVITETAAADAGAGSGGTDGEENVEYCVKGNTLDVRITTSEGMVMHYTATRQ